MTVPVRGSRHGATAPKPALGMPITYAELRHELEHVKLGQSLLGYDRKAVDMLLERLAASYEDLSGELVRLEVEGTEIREARLERDQLRLRVTELEDDSRASRKLEALIRDTLVSVERAANELRAEATHEANELRSQARKESARAVEDARSESRMITGVAERHRLWEEEEARRAFGEAQAQADAALCAAEAQRDRLDEECRELSTELRRLEGELARVGYRAFLASGDEVRDEIAPGPGGSEREPDPVRAAFEHRVRKALTTGDQATSPSPPSQRRALTSP